MAEPQPAQNETHGNNTWHEGYSTRNSFFYFICGLSMGSADVIPGVSGGTIALIMGIYEKLIAALASIRPSTIWPVLKNLPGLFNKEKRRLFIDSLERLPVFFLVPLVAGILTAVLSVVHLLKYLLFDLGVPDLVFGFFFGLILASIPIPFRAIRSRNTTVYALTAVTALLAFYLTGLSASAGEGQHTLFYVFICGAVAICAMILPGISGAFFLLVFGLYFPVTGAVTSLSAWGKAVLKGEAAVLPVNDIVLVITLIAGMLVGIFSFVQFLRWTLHNFHDLTMAAVTGLMIGGLRSLWPFKEWPAAFDEKSIKAGLPMRLPGQDGDLMIVVTALCGMLVLYLLHRVAERIEKQIEAEEGEEF